MIIIPVTCNSTDIESDEAIHQLAQDAFSMVALFDDFAGVNLAVRIDLPGHHLPILAEYGEPPAKRVAEISAAIRSALKAP